MNRDFNEKEGKPQRVALIGVYDGERDADVSMDELEELTETAGGQVIVRIAQNRRNPDPETYLGTGRLDELKKFCEDNEIELIIADDELTSTQQRAVEKATDIMTIDRTMLILDIFALHAQTSEGKLQVALAQLEYSLPRLTGKGTELSRLGGGIGTRGPGESKLESDKRHIRRRIHAVKEQLADIEKRRENLHLRRRKNRVETVAIVGYTNAGKSTLMNTLTDAGVLVENKLFATLDPTSRLLKLSDGREIILIDTVGFISRLPHKLVEAFKSTLEEAVYADVILNVCDASSPEYENHLEVTRSTLNDLGCGDKPQITVFNKCDATEDVFAIPDGRDSVKISALKGIGMDKLISAIENALPIKRRRVQILLPFNDGAKLNKLRQNGTVHSEEYREDGVWLDVTADTETLDRLI